MKWNDLDVEISFLHYKTEAEAREKWERRCRRINWDHLFVQGAEAGRCTKEDVLDFVELPYKHKIFFTRKHYVDDASLYEIRRLGDKGFTDLYGEAHLGYKVIVKYIKDHETKR